MVIDAQFGINSQNLQRKIPHPKAGDLFNYLQGFSSSTEFTRSRGNHKRRVGQDIPHRKVS